jgi:cytoskeletal protein CcmA (bactofilin family)
MDSREEKKSVMAAAEDMTEGKIENSETIIARGAHFKGLVRCPDRLYVMGRVEGDIDCGGLVIIGEKARIQANIFARKVIIGGEVKGDIKSAEYVEIKPTGKLVGDLNASKIRLSDGCFFEGLSTMLDRKRSQHDSAAG